MKNDDNNEVIKTWAWIVLIVLMLTPFILKAVKDNKKPIKDDTTLSEIGIGIKKNPLNFKKQRAGISFKYS